MSRPKARLARSIGSAEAAIAAAYFDACDDAQAAVDPADMTDVAWARSFLENVYEHARATEADPAAWDVARSVFMRRITDTANVDI